MTSITNDPWKDFVLDLLEKTNKGIQIWVKENDISKFLKSKEKAEIIFKTEYIDSIIFVFEKSYTKIVYVDKDDISQGTSGSSGYSGYGNVDAILRMAGLSKSGIPKEIDTSKISLIISDKKLITGWELPIDDNLKDLFDAIKYNLSGANQIMDKFKRKS